MLGKHIESQACT